MVKLADTELADLPIGFATALSKELRRKLDETPCNILRFDALSLSRRWGVEAEKVEAAIFEASRLAGLAVGVIGDGHIDVMTGETAHQLWAAGVNASQITLHEETSLPLAPIDPVH